MFFIQQEFTWYLFGIIVSLITHAVPPSPPQNLRALFRGQDYIIVAWNIPTRPGSRNLTYGVYISSASTFTSIQKIQEVNQTITIISSKLICNTYSYIVVETSTIKF